MANHIRVTRTGVIPNKTICNDVFSSGLINCGKKEIKKIIALGLSTLESRPCKKEDVSDFCSVVVVGAVILFSLIRVLISP